MKLSEKLNGSFVDSIEKGRVTEVLGEALIELSNEVVNRSKLKDRNNDTREIVSSDVVFGLYKAAVRLLKNNRGGDIKNPYGYFRNSAVKMISSIMRYRFSSMKTQDVFGKPITALGVHNPVVRCEFLQLNEGMAGFGDMEFAAPTPAVRDKIKSY